MTNDRADLRVVFTTDPVDLLDEAPEANWIVEVPLLFEKQLENWFDFIVCVASSADVQLARLIERGIPHTLAEQRISKQLPLARKIALADLVLWNDGPIPFLRAQVQSLHQALHLGLGSGGSEVDVLGSDADLFGVAPLVPDVDPAGFVVADQHGGQANRDASLGERGHPPGHLFLDAGCHQIAIQDQP